MNILLTIFSNNIEMTLNVSKWNDIFSDPLIDATRHSL